MGKPTLLRTGVRLVDPEPRADAFAVRALGHLRRDGEARVHIPHARLVHAEYGEVLRLDLRDVRLVRDGQRAATEIVDAIGVEFLRAPPGTRIVRVAGVTLVPTGTRGPIGRRILVAGDLKVSRASNRQLHDVLRVWRRAEMTVLIPKRILE